MKSDRCVPENAARCLRLVAASVRADAMQIEVVPQEGESVRPRLSRNLVDDVAFLEALAAALNQKADQIEVAEAARGTAGRGYVASATSGPLRPSEMSPPHDPNYDMRSLIAKIIRDIEPLADAPPDRRRTVPQNEVSPVLIPLLREDSMASDVAGHPADDRQDQLRASRGIIIWTLISAIVWLSLLLGFGGLGI
jgi:hypothetical protein